MERFLGAGRETVTTVARETLEGLLRSVISRSTIEELKEDHDFVAQELLHRGSTELRSLGLVLDTFHIKRVDDAS